MKGRHSPDRRPSGSGEAESPSEEFEDYSSMVDAGDDEDPGEGTGVTAATVKKILLWVGLGLCVAFIAWMAWGFLQFDNAIEHPREGGFSGWQCDAGRDCGS